jgi:RNA polymerase sigma-70 factor, ECF subfamily
MTKGDQERFESFVRASRRSMFRIAQNLCRTSGVDPEDLVAETLERVLRQLERGAGADPLALPFIATVMANRHVDLCRRRRAEGVSEHAVPEVEPEEEGVVTEPEPMERWRSVPDAELREAMAALEPERLREVYRLHASGLRYRQIAERLGIPEGTVGSDLSVARRQLRRQLLGRPE